MIISEKQIMLLMNIAREAVKLADAKNTNMWEKWAYMVVNLIEDITAQQSEELKSIPSHDCGLDRSLTWMEILDDYVHGKDEIAVCKTCHSVYVKVIDCEYGSLEETDIRKCFKCGVLYS